MSSSKQSADVSLHDIGMKYRTDKATDHHYLEFYQKYLPKPSFSGRLLEVGVYSGASMSMWREYYPKAEIIGVDIIVPSNLRIDGVELIKMDGTDADSLQTLGTFDIIIDDGSHKTADQQATFEQLYYHQLNKNGLYVLEDLHTSLIPKYVNSELDTLTYLERLNLPIIHYRRDANEDDSMTCIIRGKK